MDGRGFQPQFLSDTPGFHSDNMAARWRSRRARCMTGRDERERSVHCANREGREGGRTAPERSLCRDAMLFRSFVEKPFFYISVYVSWMQKQPSHKASLQIRNQRVADIPGNYNRKYNGGKQFRGTDAPNGSEIFTKC